MLITESERELQEVMGEFEYCLQEAEGEGEGEGEEK